MLGSPDYLKYGMGIVEGGLEFQPYPLGYVHPETFNI
jgi:hypothetical protein